MDQKRIGAFIAQCRREKNLTQMQLAELLDICQKLVLYQDLVQVKMRFSSS